MKDLRYRLEGAGLWLAFFVFSMLPVETASSLGGWIGRTVGMRLAASRKAYNNLSFALPQKTKEEQRLIVREMWDNLGRIIAEYPHLKEIITDRCEIIGEEHIKELGSDVRAITIGGHIGNWELLPFYFNYKIDWPMTGAYRAPNNPYVEKLLEKVRSTIKRGKYVRKSAKGVREMIKTLQDGGFLGLLIDQKYNQGLPVPFFGRPAMTASAFVQLARRFSCPILPIRTERLPNCRFKITLYESFTVENMTEYEAVLKGNGILEGWIREKPGQWLWIHRRWSSKALEENPSTES